MHAQVSLFGPISISDMSAKLVQIQLITFTHNFHNVAVLFVHAPALLNQNTSHHEQWTFECTAASCAAASFLGLIPPCQGQSATLVYLVDLAYHFHSLFQYLFDYHHIQSLPCQINQADLIVMTLVVDYQEKHLFLQETYMFQHQSCLCGLLALIL